MTLKKASLIELDTEYNEKQGGKQVEVQFNPETLKVTFANQIVQPSSTGSNTSSGSTGSTSGTGYADPLVPKYGGTLNRIRTSDWTTWDYASKSDWGLG